MSKHWMDLNERDLDRAEVDELRSRRVARRFAAGRTAKGEEYHARKLEQRVRQDSRRAHRQFSGRDK